LYGIPSSANGDWGMNNEFFGCWENEYIVFSLNYSTINHDWEIVWEKKEYFPEVIELLLVRMQGN
jgi:hypothetical protein